MVTDNIMENPERISIKPRKKRITRQQVISHNDIIRRKTLEKSQQIYSKLGDILKDDVVKILRVK